ncbi:phosphate signaling complex protein PhoU [Sphingomonas sp. SUN039]|uniref:phosphate signaling complex protein PhoU n=1 Tax=Sphingomonas sp. SUN039 TaxID=2937787 RepID=UPI0021647356|nr:phosphate signaling complex protein PhoU [Sphingomonas sp. SUN039]UVO54087.1 phosphate signaling complex protein PhoU [Sphingomonas sp. SUN039]
MAIGTEHTVKAFDDEIGELRGHIAEMGGRAEAAIASAMEALVKRDLDLARKVIEEDKAIDRLESEVEKLAVRIIALRAPMADDLRDVIAALKIAAVLERIGDYAKNIAKRAGALEGRRKIEPISLLPSMAKIATEMVHDVLNAYAARDAALAVAVNERDKVVDDFYNSIFRTLVTYMVENPQSIGNAAHLLFVAKNIERVGDHATNVAEMVYFAATGEYMAERDKGDPFAEDEGA